LIYQKIKKLFVHRRKGKKNAFFFQKIVTIELCVYFTSTGNESHTFLFKGEHIVTGCKICMKTKRHIAIALKSYCLFTLEQNAVKL